MMVIVECVYGPLDGVQMQVRDDVRRIFYAPRTEWESSWTFGSVGDESTVPDWMRPRLTGRYFRPAQNPKEAFWKPYEHDAPA